MYRYLGTPPSTPPGTPPTPDGTWTYIPKKQSPKRKAEERLTPHPVKKLKCRVCPLGHCICDSMVMPKAFTSLANIPQMPTPPGGYEKPGYEADFEASQKLLQPRVIEP